MGYANPCPRNCATLECGDVSSAFYYSIHKGRDPTSRTGRSLGWARAVLYLGRSELNSPQFWTEFCHPKPKSTFCVTKALQSLIKAYLLVSTSNLCLHWRKKHVKETKRE